MNLVVSFNERVHLGLYMFLIKRMLVAASKELSLDVQDITTQTVTHPDSSFAKKNERKVSRCF